MLSYYYIRAYYHVLFNNILCRKIYILIHIHIKKIENNKQKQNKQNKRNKQNKQNKTKQTKQTKQNKQNKQKIWQHMHIYKEDNL